MGFKADVAPPSLDMCTALPTFKYRSPWDAVVVYRASFKRSEIQLQLLHFVVPIELL